MKYENINLLRAFAALQVVVYHVIEHFQWVTFPVSGPLLTFRIGWMGVDLFYVISGFVIASSAFRIASTEPEQFYKIYWKHRCARILPLYLLTCVLWLLLYRPGFFVNLTADDLKDFAVHLLFIHNTMPDTHGSINGVSWTLAVEMQFYILVALLVPWLARSGPWLILAVFVSIAWVWRGLAFLYAAEMDTFGRFFYITQFPGALDAFGVGICIAKLLPDIRGRLAYWAGPVIAMLTFFAGYFLFSWFWAVPDYWHNPVMVVVWRSCLALFFGFVLVAALTLPQLVASKPLYPLWLLGEVSYGLYLWHLFPIMFIKTELASAPGKALVITLIVTTALAWLSWKALEEPVVKFSRRKVSEGKMPFFGSKDASVL